MDYGTVGVSHPRIIISHSVSTHVIHEVEPDECEGATVCSTPTRYRRLDNGLLKSFARLVIIIPLKLLSRICFSVFSICLFLGIVLYCTLKSQGILAKFATVLISTSIYAMFASRLATMTIRTSKYYLERSKHSDADNLDRHRKKRKLDQCTYFWSRGQISVFHNVAVGWRRIFRKIPAVFNARFVHREYSLHS